MRTNLAFILFALAATLSVAAMAESPANPAATRESATSGIAFKDALAKALKENQVDARLQCLSEIGSKLDLAEIPVALDAADGLKELRERMVLKQTTLNRWSELAPQDAFAHIARFPENQLKANTLREAAARFAKDNPTAAAAAAEGMNAGRTRCEMLELIARVWAQTNAAAAMSWARKLPDGFARQSALEAIRYVWVHSDPVAAAADLEKLPPGQTRNNLIANAAFEWAALDPQAAIRWVEHLPDQTDRDAAIPGIAESWANRDPKAAAAFALELPPGDARANAGAMVAARWSKQDPRQAADWAWRCEDEEVRRRGLKEVLELWASVDPADSARWVESLPAGTNRDEVIHEYVTAVMPWAPEFAAKTCLLLKEEPARFQALDECMPTWIEVDTASATNWLAKTQMPETLKTRWTQPARSE